MCQPGTADKDRSSTTTCDECDVGQYTTFEAMQCTDCLPGRADTDSNPSTPCVPCPHGTFADTKASECESCRPGRYDDDGNSATVCVECPAGTYQPAAAQNDCSICGTGTYSGVGVMACDDCGSGRFDHDSDPASPCVDCPAGTFQPAAAQNDCSICDSGTYSGVGVMACDDCGSGRFDHDRNASTPCTQCPVGTHSEPRAITCNGCKQVGLFDNDTDPATPCFPCPFGLLPDVNSTACTECPAGKEPRCSVQPDDSTIASYVPWSHIECNGQRLICADCLEGQFRSAGNGLQSSECGGDDECPIVAAMVSSEESWRYGCQLCDQRETDDGIQHDTGRVCPLRGMPFPLPKTGF
eukprot:COSAG06_NODE_15591_length_1059_cov_27.981250_1_plen_353_part_11